MGSDTTLVRKDLVNNLGLPELGSSKLRFGTAGGNIHEEFSKEFMLEVKPLKSSDVSFTIAASCVEKPCFDVCRIPASVVNQYEHLRPFSDQIVSGGGQVDLLIGRNYAPYIQSLKVV